MVMFRKSKAAEVLLPILFTFLVYPLESIPVVNLDAYQNFSSRFNLMIESRQRQAPIREQSSGSIFKIDSRTGFVTSYRTDAKPGVIYFKINPAHHRELDEISFLGDSTDISYRFPVKDFRAPSENSSRQSRLEPLEIILERHYGTNYAIEKSSYQRLHRLRPSVNYIADAYERVDTKLLLAIIKCETQAISGRVSHKAAIGLAQIKFQGAFAFFWNALYQDYTHVNGRRQKDYHNTRLRQRYQLQLARMQNYLQDTEILVSPYQHQDAKKQTWRRLKRYLNENTDRGFYLVDVDIAAMYLDHLIHTFRHIGEKANELKDHLEQNIFTDMDDMTFSGTRHMLWAALKKSVENGLVNGDFNMEDIDTDSIDCPDGVSNREGETISYHHGLPCRSPLRQMIIQRLDELSRRAHDPLTWYSAYNVGPTVILRRLKKEKKLPYVSGKYARDILFHMDVLSEIYSGQGGLYSEKFPEMYLSNRQSSRELE